MMNFGDFWQPFVQVAGTVTGRTYSGQYNMLHKPLFSTNHCFRSIL